MTREDLERLQELLHTYRRNYVDRGTVLDDETDDLLDDIKIVLEDME